MKIINTQFEDKLKDLGDLSMTYRFPDYQIGKKATFLQDRNLGNLREKEICLHL